MSRFELTADQHHALSRTPDEPPTAHDPASGVTYVLVPADVYERVKHWITQADDDSFAHAMYPRMWKVFGPAGWDDPIMDVYDTLEPTEKP